MKLMSLDYYLFQICWYSSFWYDNMTYNQLIWMGKVTLSFQIWWYFPPKLDHSHRESIFVARLWALPLNHCVSCGELSGTHCPGRAAHCPCTLGEQHTACAPWESTDWRSTLPCPGLTYPAYWLLSDWKAHWPQVLPLQCPADQTAVNAGQKSQGYPQVNFHLYEFIKKSEAFEHIKVGHCPLDGDSVISGFPFTDNKRNSRSQNT